MPGSKSRGISEQMANHYQIKKGLCPAAQPNPVIMYIFCDPASDGTIARYPLAISDPQPGTV